MRSRAGRLCTCPRCALTPSRRRPATVERRERDAVYLLITHISAQLIFMRSTLSKCVSCTHSLIAELEQARTYPAQKPARTAPPVLRLLPSPLQCRQP